MDVDFDTKISNNIATTTIT